MTRGGLLAGRELHGRRKLFFWEGQNVMLITLLNSTRGNHSWIWDVYVNFVLLKNLNCQHLDHKAVWLFYSSRKIWRHKHYSHNKYLLCVHDEGEVRHQGWGWREGGCVEGGNRDKVSQVQPYSSGSLHFSTVKTRPLALKYTVGYDKYHDGYFLPAACV